MPDTNNRNATGGIGFVGALTLLLIAFKLAGIIDWSWWLVLLPALAATALAVGAFLAVILTFLITVLWRH